MSTLTSHIMPDKLYEFYKEEYAVLRDSKDMRISSNVPGHAGVMIEIFYPEGMMRSFTIKSLDDLIPKLKELSKEVK